MILDGGLILQALAGGGSSGGGKVKPITITENGTYNVSDAEKAEGYVGFAPVTVDVPQSCLNMCDLFEQQTPIAVIPLFGDYTAKLVQLPEGVWQSRIRQYQTYIYENNYETYCSDDRKIITCILGVYRGDTLLYLGYPTTSDSSQDGYSAENVYDDDGNIIAVNVWKSHNVMWTYRFSEMTVSENVNITSFYKYIQVPTAGITTYYASDGTVTENTFKSTWNLTISVGGSDWWVTRFTCDELIAPMDICAQDVYAEYRKRQST